MRARAMSHDGLRKLRARTITKEPDDVRLRIETLCAAQQFGFTFLIAKDHELHDEAERIRTEHLDATPATGSSASCATSLSSRSTSVRTSCSVLVVFA